MHLVCTCKVATRGNGHSAIDRMGQARLNGLMMSHVHKKKTDSLSLINIVNLFVNSEYRKSVFGTFTTNDM